MHRKSHILVLVLVLIPFLQGASCSRAMWGTMPSLDNNALLLFLSGKPRAALTSIGYTNFSVPALIANLDTYDDFQKMANAWILGEIGEDAAEAIPTLLALLKSNWAVGVFAKIALTEIGPPAVPVLLKDLEHKWPTRRKAAAGCLAAMGPRAIHAAPYLIALVSKYQKRKAPVPVGIIIALGEILASEPFPYWYLHVLPDMAAEQHHLKEFLARWENRTSGHRLEMMSEHRLRGVLPELQSSHQEAQAISMEKNLKLYLLAIEMWVARGRAKPRVPTSDTKIRQQALDVLSDILVSTNRDEAKAAIASIGKMGHHARRLTNMLLGMLQHPEPEFQLAAAWALINVSAEKAIMGRALIRLLSSNDWPLRELATRALVMASYDDVFCAKAITELTRRLDDERPEVRKAAQQTIDELEEAKLQKERKKREKVYQELSPGPPDTGEDED